MNPASLYQCNCKRAFLIFFTKVGPMKVISSPASLSSSPGEGSESLQLLTRWEGSPSFSLLSRKLAVTLPTTWVFCLLLQLGRQGLATGAHLQHRHLLGSFGFPYGASLKWCWCDEETEAVRGVTNPSLQRGRAAVPTQACLPPKTPHPVSSAPGTVNPPRARSPCITCLV